MRTKYSEYEVSRFFTLLGVYKEALARGTKKDIIYSSLAIHAAKAGVPRSYWSLVNKTYNETIREIPLED
jgi:hypothetical protein